MTKRQLDKKTRKERQKDKKRKRQKDKKYEYRSNSSKFASKQLEIPLKACLTAPLAYKVPINNEYIPSYLNI